MRHNLCTLHATVAICWGSSNWWSTIKPLYNWFQLATASNLWEPLANQLENMYFSLPTVSCVIGDFLALPSPVCVTMLWSSRSVIRSKFISCSPSCEKHIAYSTTAWVSNIRPITQQFTFDQRTLKSSPCKTSDDLITGMPKFTQKLSNSTSALAVLKDLDDQSNITYTGEGKASTNTQHFMLTVWKQSI